MTEAPHASPTPTRWSVLLPLSGSALLASATGGMSGDLFNLFLTGELGFSPAVLSVIYAGMLLSLPLQLAGPTIARRFRFHTLMTAGAVVSAAAVVAILLVVHLPVGDRLQLTVVIVAAVLVEIAFSLSYGTVWSAWLGEVCRDEDRPTVLSLGKLLSQGTLVACFTLQAVVFNGDVTTTLYTSVCVWVLVYLAGSVVVYLALPDPGIPDSTDAGLSPRGVVRGTLHDLAVTLRTPAYRLILVCESCQFFIGVPLLSVYLMQVIGVPSQTVGFVLIARTVGSMVFMLFLGPLTRRFGARSVLCISGGVSTAALVPWLLVPVPGSALHTVWTWLPVVLVPVLFAAKSVFSTSVDSIAYDLVPREDRVVVFTVSDVVSSGSLQLTGMLGAWLVATSSDGPSLVTGGVGVVAASTWILAGVVVSVVLTVRFSRAAR